MQHDDAKSTQDAAREILGYFLRNPQAADDITGIARWRLMRETVRLSVEQTSDAVEWLITEGFLTEDRRAASGRIFHLNAPHREAAEAFLRQNQDREG